MYDVFSANGWQGNVLGQTQGTCAAGKWNNYDSQLPSVNYEGNQIAYKEFDVNHFSGGIRDSNRFAVGSDGKVYYTYDHYSSFVEIFD